MANIDDANSRCILLRFGFRFCALLAFVSPIGAGVYLTFAAFIKLRAELPNGRTIPAPCDIHPRHPHGNANKCPAAIYCRRSLRACRDAYARNNEAREGFGIRERARFLSPARHLADIDRGFKFRRKRLAIKASSEERSIGRISALFPEFNRD